MVRSFHSEEGWKWTAFIVNVGDKIVRVVGYLRNPGIEDEDKELCSESEFKLDKNLTITAIRVKDDSGRVTVQYRRTHTADIRISKTALAQARGLLTPRPLSYPQANYAPSSPHI